MPSQLDRELDAVIETLTAPGAPLEPVSLPRNGYALAAFRNAPPSLAAYFAHFCREHADKPFLVDGDLRLTFGEVHALAIEAAMGLINRYGLRRGDRVGIAARNSANWVIAYMAVLIAGGCATLLNGWWTTEELADGLAISGCRLILADPARAARLGDQPEGTTVVTFEHGDPRQGLASLLGSGEAALPSLGPDDLATILFTSGSTGRSKGAASDHRGVVHGAMTYAGLALTMVTYLARQGKAPTVQPCIIAAVPLFHVTGEVAVLLASFAIGRKVVIMARWDALEAMRLIEAERITYFVGVPLMSHEIATHPQRDRFDLASCLHFAAGGAPRPVEHVRAIRDAMPHAFPLLGYGLTETNALGCGNVNENYLAKPGSTGTPNRPLADVAILDDAGQVLAQGQQGEVAIRSVANFLGYWRDPEATKAAVTDDGYFRTGDLGYFDADGYLFIVDRKKDVIIRGGENIAASEVEAAIYAHPGIAEASVFGLPDARLGEVPVAVYVAKPGCVVDPEDLRQHLALHIAGFKIPAKFWQEPGNLPRLGTEKIDKRALKARYAR